MLTSYRNIAIEHILERVKTPSYVLDLDKVRSNIRKIKNSISYPNFQIHYAMFSNDNELLLQIIREEGAGILVLNESELQTALNSGFSKVQIHLTGGTFTRESLMRLLKYGININLDSLNQIELAGKISKGLEIGIRIRLCGNNYPDSGEGIASNDLEKILVITEKYKLKIIGVHTYIGTNTLDEKKYIDSALTLIDMAVKFKNLRYINLGGGFGIPYSSKDSCFNWTYFGKEITSVFDCINGNINNRIQLKIEPGRSIVGDAGYFVTRIIEIREDSTLIVDAPYTNFPRPFFYHKNHRVNCISNEAEKRKYSIRGCTINRSDYLSNPEFEGDCAMLPENIKAGDILYFSDAGAYSPVMQMDFLHNKKAPTFIISNGELIV
jgi:diaminopimelate decarboxylase